MNKETRFEFGNNWKNFLQHLNDEQIIKAQESLCEMLETNTLKGKSFLDIGSGSGLFSLAALKLGAEIVYSFDCDIQCVACGNELKKRFAPHADNWIIEQGSILDTNYLKKLPQFDIVYAWGVLHHTGNMRQALENVIPLVKSGGKLFIAIYNDQGGRSRIWKKVKILYHKLPKCLRILYVMFIMCIFELKYLIFSLLQGKSPFPKDKRGMRKYYDWVDWVGGYPFEVAKPEEIFQFFKKRGFTLERLKTCGGECGNNEFVFTKNVWVYDLKR